MIVQTYLVDYENRTTTIQDEDRTIVLSPENRSVSVKQELRSIDASKLKYTGTISTVSLRSVLSRMDGGFVLRMDGGYIVLLS